MRDQIQCVKCEVNSASTGCVWECFFISQQQVFLAVKHAYMFAFAYMQTACGTHAYMLATSSLSVC